MSRYAKRRKGEPNEESASKRIKPVDLAAADHNIDSDDEEHDYDSDDNDAPGLESSSEEDMATKKVRLAKEYLQKIEKDGSESESSGEEDDDEEASDDDDEDRIGRRLQRQRMKLEGTFERELADKIAKQVDLLAQKVKVDHASTAAASAAASERQAEAWVDAGHVQLLRGHDLTPTSVAMTSDGTRAISGSKDHSVLLWDIDRATKLSTLRPHWKKQQSNHHADRTAGQVLSVACSDDGRYAAVGSRDSYVRIFDIRTEKIVKEFHGHKGAVTSVAFRSNSLELFSASEDRCIRHYNLQEMMYMETLYGHQFGVTAIDCHHKERPISVGRDRTARAWKLAEDTHLIYRGGSRIQSAESISLIKDDWFLTGHEDGNLSLWYTEKKKAVAVQPAAHGLTSDGLGRGIVSVRSVYGSDFCATGSCDGYLRLWKVQTGSTVSERGLSELNSPIPLHGYVNSIAIGPKGRFAVVAKGQEHRLGRWNPVKRAKNRLAIVKLYTQGKTDDDDDDAKADKSDEESESESEISTSDNDSSGDNE